MPDWIADVRRFHEMMDLPVASAPRVLDQARAELRRRLIREESMELSAALATHNLVEIADGIADLIYVAVGAALEAGIPLGAVWDEVHRSNMAKAGPDGKARKRSDGKVLKPEGWTPPDVASVLGIIRP